MQRNISAMTGQSSKRDHHLLSRDASLRSAAGSALRTYTTVCSRWQKAGRLSSREFRGLLIGILPAHAVLVRLLWLLSRWSQLWRHRLRLFRRALVIRSHRIPEATEFGHKAIFDLLDLNQSSSTMARLHRWIRDGSGRLVMHRMLRTGSDGRS